MSSLLDSRMERAGKLADWLSERGHRDHAHTIRGLRVSLAQMRTVMRENRALRSRLTPIAQARLSEARAGLNAELETSAALLERLAKIADTGGEGPVGIEVPDATYLADLLRRAVL